MFPQQNNYPHQYQYGAQQGYPPGGQMPPQYPQPMHYPQTQRPPQQSQGFGYPGVTPFPQYSGYHAQYQQPAYNPMPGAYSSSGPPAKRQKANPIITRYPMPTGYGPQTPTQGPSPTGPPPYNAMTQQHRHSFAQPSTNPQSGWNAQPTTNFSQPRPVTQPQTGNSLQNPWQQPIKPINQHFPQPIGPPKPGSSGGPSPATTPTVSVQAPHPPQSATSTHSAGSASVKATFNQMHHDTGYAYEVDFESSDEALQLLRHASVAGDTTDTDQKFSLGIITWHPPRLITTPLASTFELAQLDLVSPPPPRKPEDSISKFHGPNLRHLISMSVKSTPDWNIVKDDIIFRLFERSSRFVTLQRTDGSRGRPSLLEESVGEEEELITAAAGVKSLPETVAGPSAEEVPVVRASIVDEEKKEEGHAEAHEQAMDTASDDDQASRTEPAKVDSAKSEDTPPEQLAFKSDDNNAAKAPNPLDHLEAMLTKASQQSTAAGDNGHRSRTASGQSSQGSIRDTRPESAQPADPLDAPSGRDSRGDSRAGLAPIAPMGKPLYGLHNIPPPPPPLEPDHGPSRAHQDISGDNTPDVEMEEEPAAEDTPPKGRDHPALARTSSTRKRTFEEAQGPQQEERRRQEDDLTPRLRRQRQKMEPAYSRR